MLLCMVCRWCLRASPHGGIVARNSMHHRRPIGGSGMTSLGVLRSEAVFGFRWGSLRGSSARRQRALMSAEPFAPLCGPPPCAPGSADHAEATMVESSACFDVELLAHTDRLYLDKVEGGYQLCDILTFERKLLKGDWGLCYDEDEPDRAVLVHTVGGVDEVVCVEQHMRLDIGLSGIGERFLLSRDAGSKIRHFSLDLSLSKHTVADAVVLVGATTAKTTLPIYIMKRPRSHCMVVFWDIVALYRVLRFKAFKGQASKWLHNSAPRWRRCLNDYFPGECLVYGKHGNSSDSFIDSCPWYDRCLPSTSISTSSLIFLLAVWAYASPRKNGLRGKDEKSASFELLAALLKQAFLQVDTKPLVLCFDESWSCRWPRPNLAFDESLVCISVIFCDDDAMDLTEVVAARPCACSYLHAFQSALRHCGCSDRASSLRIVDFLKVCVEQDFLSLGAQVCWFLARNLEASLSMQNRGTNSGADGSVSVQTSTGLLSVSSKDLGEKLSQYVVASVRESAKHGVVSLATDGANLAGMHLQNTMRCFKSNVAAVCCPVVLSLRPSARHRSERVRC